MEVPPEILAPRPRDVRAAHARRLFDKQRALARTSWIGGVVVAVGFMVWAQLSNGSFLSMPWVTFGVAGFIWAGALFLELNVVAGKRILRDGIVVEGRVTEVKGSRNPLGPTDRQAFVVSGRFDDPGGKARTFSTNTGLVQVADIGCKVGDPIPVLHLESRPKNLMIWLPGLGLMMAFARDA